MGQIVDGNDLISLLTDGAITSVDALVSKRTGGSNGNPQYPELQKEWRVAGVQKTGTAANQWHSGWTNDGRPCAGAAPGSFANPTNTTAGALQQANASGGRDLRLFSLCGLVTSPGQLWIYDRLLHVSGLSGTVTTAQNLNGGSAATVSRYTTGERNELWLEIYTALGSTATTATVSYTNQAGSAKTTQPVVIGAAGRNEAGRIIKCSLAAGDFGVRDATSVTLAASTLTAGDFGVTIARPLAVLPIGVVSGGQAIYFGNGPFQKVLSGACLTWAWLASVAANVPFVTAQMELVEA